MSRHRRQQLERPDLEPLEVDEVKVAAVGSAVWLVAFLVLLPFYGRLAHDGRAWWLWCALAGFGIGVLGVAYCRRRRDARTEALSSGRRRAGPGR